MRDNFPTSLRFTLGFEGGFVHHPADPGGATNKGITLATLRRHRPGASVADLKALPDALVAQIYRADYWDAVRGDDLPAGVDLATFDYAVNSGPSAARKGLRAVAGGPDHETVRRLCARRLSIYQTFRHWKTFGRGWARRIAACEALGVRMALAAERDAPHVAAALGDEARRAARGARRSTAGAAAATGSGAAAVPLEVADPTALALAGALAGAVVLTGLYLAWRAHVDRLREEALRAALQEVQA
ncbi:glycosyl hydrolase 108 family protein [Chelatococcus sp. SYSU_G07232]|uniref:Glycosyl hydrolase 108 family protein n=1 Tax=Chelatococcus albus TaxID=3047466 RepID=A0ABT7ADX8_9HYPH|nr:glycosyl hydrolase 108 family protein [Chelatococcus sp. SYSU_G07232]MDJ1157564.1 glycosyl hydrolase 108 family protein [Chelatococcus sp. SYSU_G07232]